MSWSRQQPVPAPHGHGAVDHQTATSSILFGRRPARQARETGPSCRRPRRRRRRRSRRPRRPRPRARPSGRSDRTAPGSRSNCCERSKNSSGFGFGFGLVDEKDKGQILNSPFSVPSLNEWKRRAGEARFTNTANRPAGRCCFDALRPAPRYRRTKNGTAARRGRSLARSRFQTVSQIIYRSPSTHSLSLTVEESERGRT